MDQPDRTGGKAVDRERARTRYARGGREALWIAAGQVAASAGAVVGVRIMTGALTPRAYGHLALGMTAGVLAQQVLLGPLASASLRFFAAAREQRQVRNYLLATGRLLRQISLLVLCSVPPACLTLVALGVGAWARLLLAAALYALLLGYDAALDSMQTAARQRVTVAWHDALAAWMRYPLAVALISLVGATGTVALLGFALSAAVVLVSQLWFFRHRILTLTRSELPSDASAVNGWVVKMRAYSWPFATWGLFTWVQLSADRWSLQLTHGSDAVGLYNAVYQIGYLPLLILANAAVQFLAPIIFSRAGDASDPGRLRAARRLTSNVVHVSLALAVVGALTTYLLRHRVVSLLLAPDFRSSADLLAPLVLAGGIFAAGQIAALAPMIAMEPQRLIAPKVVTAIVGAGLNVAGALLFGAHGVAYAAVVFSALYYIWTSQLAGPGALRATHSTDTA